MAWHQLHLLTHRTAPKAEANTHKTNKQTNKQPTSVNSDKFSSDPMHLVEATATGH